MTRYRPARAAPLVVRWTVGNVSRQGFEALRWSLLGASQLFDAAARYVVCVNTVPARTAAALVGSLPVDVEWLPVSSAEMPAFIRDRLDANLAEGVGWKFAPFRIDQDAFELSLDNDCILWEMPDAVRQWLDHGARPLIAEDVRACFGQFGERCGSAPRNSGIRGLPPRWPFEEDVQDVLELAGRPLASETDEQGLQVAAITLRTAPFLVRTTDVTICSPFRPHQPYVADAGATSSESIRSRSRGPTTAGPALEVLHDHWRRLRATLAARIDDPARVSAPPRPSSA